MILILESKGITLRSLQVVRRVEVEQVIVAGPHFLEIEACTAIAVYLDPRQRLMVTPNLVTNSIWLPSTENIGHRTSRHLPQAGKRHPVQCEFLKPKQNKGVSCRWDGLSYLGQHIALKTI